MRSIPSDTKGDCFEDDVDAGDVDFGLRSPFWHGND